MRTLDDLLLEARRREAESAALYNRLAADIGAVERQLAELYRHRERAIKVIERDRAERQRIEAELRQQQREARTWQH